MKNYAKLIFAFFICLMTMTISAQNPTGTWDSSSGSSFKAVANSGGMKYYNLAGGNWINASYIGNNQYQAYFYNGSTLVDILTFTMLDKNTIQVTYYNGKTYYWNRRGSSNTTASTIWKTWIPFIPGSAKSKAIQIEQYQFQVKVLNNKIKEERRRLADYQSRNTNYGATSFMTEQSSLNLIATYENQVRQYEREISRLRGY
ncbi:MAG: hypothetical protein R2825_17985 [Saprospiraceae bacterium]